MQQASTVSLEFKKQKLTGKIIGLDIYYLEDFNGSYRSWPSYTIVSNKKGLFNRYWLTDWKKDGWILWTGYKKKLPPKTNILFKRSGIATIKFSGKRGISTPSAALVVYTLSNGVYFAMERFAASGVMYFLGRKIRKQRIT